MSLAYLAGSLGGVALLVLLCAALFGTRLAVIPPPAALEAYLAKFIPGFKLRAMAADAATALLEGNDGSLHLVVARGDGLVARLVTPSLVRAVEQDGAALKLRLADFTLPSARLELRDADEASRWRARLR